MQKSLILTIFLLLTAIFAFAQPTQTGYVKTKGRMDSHGNLIPGSRIGGVSIQLTGGHSTVADANGDFNLTVPDKKFYLANVQKQGYELVDPDVLKKQYTCSSNPLVISMETKEKLADDQLAAERKLRRQLQKQLQQREDEIDALKEENKITEEEYRQALQKLYEYQEGNEKLISDMAKRYAELDYDLLDEFYRQVSFCIENGDLVKADSLLRSRGDVSQQIKDVQKKAQALNEEKEQLRQAEAVLASDIEELGRRCYSFYEKFSSQFENDSAAHYLELRANLDTTNVEWQLEAGSFILRYQTGYKKALDYYQRALRQSISQNGKSHPEVAKIYNNIGLIYHARKEYTRAMNYYQKAMAVRNSYHEDLLASVGIHLKGEDIKGDDLATFYNNIGEVYTDQGNFTQALEYNQKALNIRKLLGGEKDPNVAQSYSNIGRVYNGQGDFTQALEYYQKALDIFESLYGKIHPFVATCYHNIGGTYYNQGDYVHALEYCQQALDIRKSVLGENHPDTKNTANRIELLQKKMLAQDSVAMQQYVFTLTFDAEAAPELSGEYVVLAYNDWNVDDTKSLYDVRNEMKGEPTTVLLMKEDVITQHIFEKSLDVSFDLKQVGKKEKARVAEMYHQWEKEHGR